MKGKILKRLLCALLCIILVAGLTACGSSQTASSTGPVTIKFFSNLPDRTTGQGKLEQTLLDNYMKENPNIKIEVEALQDEPFKQKFKAYTASNNVPDIFMMWGGPAYLYPFAKAGYLAELNPNDYKDSGFFDGSLQNFSMSGKLYGLPRNTDFWVLMYNKDLFDQNGVKVPTNYQELMDAATAFRAKGIAPVAMNGKDKWNINEFIQDLVIQTSGDQEVMRKADLGMISFSKEPKILNAVNLMKQLMDVKLYQDAFTAADYGAANNLFKQGKAAMYYIGSWEMGLAADDSIPFKDKIHAIKLPSLDSSKNDLLAGFGGGYGVSAKSKVKPEALKLLNYMMKQDNWAKMAWQTGALIPAQKFDKYTTGKENTLQKELANILNSATSIAGYTWNDYSTPDYKATVETLAQEVAAGLDTPQQFLEACDKAVADNKDKLADIIAGYKAK